MPTVKLQFPSGRYHATPWGHHVNEGLIEWPPSPWRLLRAFIACGFSSQGWSEIPPIAQSLVQKLAAVLPKYSLPPATAAHSRHFMPVGTIAKGREQTTLVFDTWANLGDGQLFIHWPCDLDIGEAELFRKLVSSLGYLGRSESWVEAELVDDASFEWNAVPCLENEHRDFGWEQISVMAAIPPEAYQQWREAKVRELLQPFDGQKQIASVKKKQLQTIAPYPSDLLSCLTKDSSWWKGHGWSQPPGSQRILYWRRTNAICTSVLTDPKIAPAPRIECMLLSIASPSGSMSSLPHVSRTLPQAELLRRALISRSANGKSIDCPLLLGRDEFGPLRQKHDHVHFIPLDLDDDNHLEHVLIFAPGGLCAVTQRGIRSLKRTWTKGGVGELQLAIVASGKVADLRGIKGPRLDNGIGKLLGSLAGSRIWVSHTPFVAPRFLKARGKNSLFGQVQAELSSRGLPSADSVEVDMELSKSLRHFVRRRSRCDVAPKNDVGYGIRIILSKAIQGPLTLGYGSHFGLGLFSSLPE